MSPAQKLRDMPEPPEEVIQAALDGNLALFVGAGISRLLGMPSWGEMARNQLGFLRGKGVLDYSEVDQISGLNPKTQLSIARELAKENDIDLDLTVGLAGHSEGNSIYKSINDIGCVCVTTNYDKLLAPRYIDVDDGSETAAPIGRVATKEDFLVSHLDKPGTVIHLHGNIDHKESMIVTTRDYLEHYDNEFVQEFLGELFARKTVLFLGYGLEEEEVLEHILRRGSAKENSERKRFALQGYFFSQTPLYKMLYNYYRASFGVTVIGFVRDHTDYRQQETILEYWKQKLEVRPPPLSDDIARIEKVLSNG